jgi:hypothetical protein
MRREGENNTDFHVELQAALLTEFLSLRNGNEGAFILAK